MIFRKKALPRRTFLRGVGATLALPLLDAMVPAMTALADTPAAAVRRLGFVFMPMGCEYIVPSIPLSFMRASTDVRISFPVRPGRISSIAMSCIAFPLASAFLSPAGASVSPTRSTYALCCVSVFSRATVIPTSQCKTSPH